MDVAAVTPPPIRRTRDAGITFLNLSFEDKTKIWQGLSTPYQLAPLFQRLAGACLQRKATPFARVIATETEVEQQNR
jgi:hypothetical protein